MTSGAENVAAAIVIVEGGGFWIWGGCWAGWVGTVARASPACVTTEAAVSDSVNIMIEKPAEIWRRGAPCGSAAPLVARRI